MLHAAVAENEKMTIPREPGFNLTHKPAGTGTLEIWGALTPGWLGSLATGLADIGVGILQGDAYKATPSIWSATFEIQTAPGGKDLEAVDFLALTTKRVPPASALDLALTEYSLRPDEIDADAVYVEISGHDRTGFLSGILKQFSLFSLFPTKLVIDTKDGLVFDRFWIKGIGASKPSADGIASVRRSLDGLISG